MAGVWNASVAGPLDLNGEFTFGSPYYIKGCFREIIPGVPLYKSEYGGYAVHREFKTDGHWKCNPCPCECTCNECEYAGIAAANIGSAVALDSPDEMLDHYGTAVVGVLGRGLAAGYGSAAWGVLGVGITGHEDSELAIGVEACAYNLTNNPFSFEPNVAKTYDWSTDPVYPHPNAPPVWNVPCTSRERINYLCLQAGIPTNRFWIAKDTAQYPARDDSISGLAEVGSPFYAVDAELGAMDDPNSVPDWEWATPPFPIESWYSDVVEDLVNDASKGLIISGAGRFPTGAAQTILRVQRSCDDIGGRFRYGMVVDNTNGNSVFDSVLRVTGDDTNTDGGIVPEGLSWSLRGFDMRDTIFKYGLMASLGFLVDQSGNVVANGLFTLPGNLGQNGLWLGTPYVPLENNVPDWQECLPRVWSTLDKTKLVVSFYYPGSTLSYFVIDNVSKSTYFTNTMPA